MAAFTKVRKLRTGKGGFGGEVASLDDIYLVRVDEQIDKFAFLELWVTTALAPGSTLPIPKVTFKQLGTKYVVCDYLDADNNGQRYLWTVVVKWKEISESEGQDQTRPTPTIPSGGGPPAPPSTDPDDWSPKVTRRPVTVHEPAESLFYESGMTHALGTTYAARTTAGNRSAFTNSAGMPFRDQLPPHQRIQNLWTMRWMRKTVPAALIAAELHLNEETVTLDYRGYTETWEAKTAKIESVQLTETRWGNTDAWEVTVEILHDAEGHFISVLDQGITETFFPGDTMPAPGGSISISTRTQKIIQDYNGRPVVEPSNLDGAGKKLMSGDPKYLKWRDFPLVDFTGLPLLDQMVT
jgi:hypothetical protein